MADANDPSGYRTKFQRERELLTEKDEDGDWRIPKEQDRKDLRLFAQKIEDNLKTSSAKNELGRMRRLAEILDKSLRDCDEADIRLGMEDLAERNLGEGQSYAQNTKRQYLRTVQDFARKMDIEQLDDIEIPSAEQSKIDKDDVLDKEEVFQLIENVQSTRTKALIAISWECAWRASALLSLKVKHYEDVNDEYAILEAPVDTDGLKGADGQRKPVTVARAYVDNWLNEHPTNEPEDALFCRTDTARHFGEHLSPTAVRNDLNRAAESAEIDRERVYNHAFRHARATYMKKSSEYSDSDIEHTLDWVEGTSQHKRYEHISQDEKIESILRSRGIEPDSGKSTTPEFIDCPRCGQQAPYDARNCPYCAVRLDDKPSDWYIYFRQITDEDDPVRQKYDDISGTTPEYSSLPKSEFEHVRETFMRTVVRADTGNGMPEGMTHEDITEIHSNYLAKTDQVVDNIGRNQTDYELDEESFTGMSVEDLTEEELERFD